MADLSGGWDAGRVTSTAVYPTEQRANSHVVVERRFLEFLRSFRIDNVFLYRDQLQKNLLLRERFIEVDMAHLLSCDEDLASNIKERPKEYLALVRAACMSRPVGGRWWCCVLTVRDRAV
nr:minichromosome maintenance protein 5 [Polyrhizophydium stewartii]